MINVYIDRREWKEGDSSRSIIYCSSRDEMVSEGCCLANNNTDYRPLSMMIDEILRPPLVTPADCTTTLKLVFYF